MGSPAIPLNPVNVSTAIRKQLPRGAVVRAYQRLAMGDEGDQVLVYDSCLVCSEPRSSIAFVSRGQIVVRFRLQDFDEYGDVFTLTAIAEFSDGSKRGAVAFSFRGMGDGAGVLFVVVLRRNETYKVSLVQRTSQGRIIITGGKLPTLEIWSATEFGTVDSPYSCVWCRHIYEIEEFVLRDDRFVRKRKGLTSETYDPHEITRSPLEVRQSGAGSESQ